MISLMNIRRYSIMNYLRDRNTFVFLFKFLDCRKKGNEIMISGEYNNNRRTGKWIYNMSFQKSSNKAHKIKIMKRTDT